MRLAVATMLFLACLCAGAARAADGCGPGCHSAVSGACVVNGWETGTVAWNECPAGAHPRPPCPPAMVWNGRIKACTAPD